MPLQQTRHLQDLLHACNQSSHTAISHPVLYAVFKGTGSSSAYAKQVCCCVRRESQVEWTVSTALTAGGVKPGDVNLHVGRHYSIRDLMTWCKRMQV